MKRLSTIRTGLFPAAILVALVSLLAACKGSPQAPPPSAGPVASNYIPSTMTVIMKFEISQLMALSKNTEQDKQQFYDMLQSRAPEAKQILDALQIDVFKDIDSVALGLALFPESPLESDGVLAVKTSLALDRLTTVLKEKASDKLAVAPFTEGALQGYTVQGIGEEKKVFLTSDSGIILASGTTSMLTSAIDSSKSGSSAFSSGLLSDGLNAVDRNAQFVLALDGSIIPKDPRKGPGLPGTQDIQHAALSVKHASEKWSFKGNVRFGDPKNAENIANMIKGFLAMGGNDPETKVFAEQITIKNDKNDLVVDGYFTEEQVKGFLAKQKEQLSKFGAPR